MGKLKVLLKEFGFTNIVIKKCVSTIPDECKGVGLEIGTSSKQETTSRNRKEDIVSANGNIRLTRVEPTTVPTLTQNPELILKLRTDVEIFVPPQSLCRLSL